MPASDNRWWKKFACAFRGLRVGSRDESSFRVHAAATVIVTVAAVVLRVSLIEAAVLGLCVVTVLTAEYFNSSIEALAKAIDQNPNEHIRDALDIAAGAVLCSSIGAVLVGGLVIARRVVELSS